MTFTPETIAAWIAINVAIGISCWSLIASRREKSGVTDVNSQPGAFGRRRSDSQFNAAPLPDKKPRRPYPKVLPKFRNPNNLAETWCGRGKKPRWLEAQLRCGRSIEEFRIIAVADTASDHEQMLTH